MSVILTPNLFGYAHFAVTDLPLASMWFLTVFAFWKGLSNWKWSVVLGVLWGLALATKFPAVLIPVPLILWAHLFHRDKYVNNVFALLFIAPIFMIGIQPYLWHQTGLGEFWSFYMKVSAVRIGQTQTSGSIFSTNFILRISCLGTTRFS